MGFSTVIKPQQGFKDEITLYVDGASRIKANKIDENTLGAYSYYLELSGREKSGSMVTLGKTNNDNEIKALYWGLSQMKRFDIPIVAYSDSGYVVNCIQQGWWKKWKSNGWNKKGGLKNAQEWKQLIETIELFDSFRIEKVKGHANNELNNLVDSLNNNAMNDYLEGKGVQIEGESNEEY